MFAALTCRTVAQWQTTVFSIVFLQGSIKPSVAWCPVHCLAVCTVTIGFDTCENFWILDIFQQTLDQTWPDSDWPTTEVTIWQNLHLASFACHSVNVCFCILTCFPWGENHWLWVHWSNYWVNCTHSAIVWKPLTVTASNDIIYFSVHVTALRWAGINVPWTQETDVSHQSVNEIIMIQFAVHLWVYDWWLN